MTDEESREEEYEDLLHWAASKGITDAPPDEQQGRSPSLGFSLRIATFPDAGGRGLAAARELKLGELILRVPEKALMNGKSARQDVELARLLALFPSLSDVQSQLCLDTNEPQWGIKFGVPLIRVYLDQGTIETVLCLHLLKEVSKGRASERYPYLVHLPRYYHTASFYSSCEAQALQVEDAVAMAEGVAQTSREEWLQARPVLEKLALGRRFSTLQAWRWASATISSRTLYVPWDAAGTLCPVGDFSNYACPGVSYDSPTTKESPVEDSPCGLEIRLRDGGFEHESGEYRFYARQNYQEGQQVLLCYGTYTNLELLEHYGFLLPFNPNDKVQISLPSAEELNGSFQETAAVAPKSLYIDYEGKPSFSLLSNLRLRAAPASLLKTRRHLALAGQQISPDSDRVLFQWLKARAQRMLADCATSSHSDELLLEFLNSHRSMVEVRDYKNLLLDLPLGIVEEVERFIGSVSFVSSSQDELRLERWRLAVEWRLGFKNILRSCILRCTQVLQEFNSH